MTQPEEARLAGRRPAQATKGTHPAGALIPAHFQDAHGQASGWEAPVSWPPLASLSELAKAGSHAWWDCLSRKKGRSMA